MTSNELFCMDALKKKQDALFHGEFLDNPKAQIIAAKISRDILVVAGIPLASANAVFDLS
jgi:hypothetical protein